MNRAALHTFRHARYSIDITSRLDTALWVEYASFGACAWQALSSPDSPVPNVFYPKGVRHVYP